MLKTILLIIVGAILGYHFPDAVKSFLEFISQGAATALEISNETILKG